MHRLSITLLFVCLAVAPARSGEVFVGGAIGNADLETNLLDLNFDTDEVGFKLFAGYRFFKFLAIEGGYVNLGSSEESLLGVEFEGELDGWDLFAVGTLPLGRFELFGKAGGIRWDGRVRVRVEGQEELAVDQDGTDFAYGFGVVFRIKPVVLRLEWERFEIEDTERSQFTSLGVEFRF